MLKIVFLALIAVMIGLSFFLSRKIKDDGDFLVPKDGLPIIVVALTMAASQFGSSMLLGGVQQAQQMPVGEGFWPAVYTLLAAAVSCFINVLIAPRFKQYGDNVTPPDFIATRFGKSRFMRGYHAAAYICSITCVLASQVIGFANIGYTAGFDYTTSVILCAAVIMLLTLGSGMIGVAVTDMIQFLLIMLFLVISVFFCLQKLGTIGLSFADVASEPFMANAEMKSKFMYTLFPMIIGNMFSYEYFMRFMSCKGVKQARAASMTAGIALVICAVPVALLGAVANYCYQDVESTRVFATILLNDMPAAMRIGLMITVLMAILTSADSLLTSLSGLVARDIYGGVICHNKPVNQKTYKILTKGTIVVMSVLAALAATKFTQILKLTFLFSPLTSGTLFAPMIVGLFWKGASRKGAIASVIAGATAGILHLTNIVPLFDRVAGPALVGTVVIVVVSLLCPDKEKALKE